MFGWYKKDLTWVNSDWYYFFLNKNNIILIKKQTSWWSNFDWVRSGLIGLSGYFNFLIKLTNLFFIFFSIWTALGPGSTYHTNLRFKNMIWIIRNIKNKFFKNKMRSKTCRLKSHTINLNEIEYLQVKLSSTMNNVKKPIKLHKKKSLDKYS
jgi:hypothetical protein